MARKRAKKHEESILNWHLDYKKIDSREYKITHGIAEEEDFNDIYATSFVSDETRLLCFQL